MNITEYNHIVGDKLDLIEIFKALGDENRIRILSLLIRQELCVCEIETVPDMTQSNASRNRNGSIIEWITNLLRKIISCMNFLKTK